LKKHAETLKHKRAAEPFSSSRQQKIPFSKLLQQWDELKLHFELARKNWYSAEMIYNMLNDHTNYCYFIYLKSVLHDVQKVMKSFEGENVDPTKLIDDLVHLIRSLSSRIVNPTARVDIFVDNIDSYLDPQPFLSYELNKKLQDFKLNDAEKQNIRSRCINFTVKLFKEIRNRLPDNFSILQKMSMFSVEKCLNPMKASIVELAELMGCSPSEIDKIVNQWNNIHIVNWSSKANTYDFWTEVLSYRDASGMNPYREVADLATKLLVLPHSNAEVERLFSQMALVKNKIRNRMLNPTLSAILHIKSGLRRTNQTCSTYEFPTEMLKIIGTNQSYQSATPNEEDNTDDDILLHEFLE
jgi:hypothetical protein